MFCICAPALHGIQTHYQIIIIIISIKTNLKKRRREDLVTNIPLPPW
jgi:hypothetical protein